MDKEKRSEETDRECLLHHCSDKNMAQIVGRVFVFLRDLDLLSVEVYMIGVCHLRRSTTSAGRSFHVCVEDR